MTRTQRDRLIRRYFDYQDERSRLGKTDYQGYLRERDSRLQDCVANLPKRVFARCPFTGALCRSRFDPFDVTGLWWLEKGYYVSDGLDRQEGLVQQRGPYFRTTTGAVRWPDGVFPGELPPRAWEGKALLGATKPFVIPGVLNQPETVAVIRGLTMDDGVTAYAITYYSKTAPSSLTLTQTWRATTYSFPTPDGRSGWNQDNRPWNFDLASALRTGQLRWMLPEEQDPEHQLHEGLHGCPYVDLPGPEKKLTLWLRRNGPTILGKVRTPQNETIEPFE